MKFFFFFSLQKDTYNLIISPIYSLFLFLSSLLATVIVKALGLDIVMTVMNGIVSLITIEIIKQEKENIIRISI